jgi:hypothetical protein
MQVIETMLASFGSRLTLHFLPREHRVRLSPFGKFYDRLWNLRLGLRISEAVGSEAKLYLLPLCELNSNSEFYFGEVEQQLSATSVTFKIRERSLGLEASFRLISPFYPQNEKLSTAPFFYLDVEVQAWPSKQRQVEVVAGLQTEGVQVQPFAQPFCSGVVLTHSYQMLPDHWGGSQVQDRLSLNSHTAPLLFGVARVPQDWAGVRTRAIDNGIQISLPLPLGIKRRVRFVLATYVDTPILDVRGQDFLFKYTQFFPDLTAVVKYALEEESFIRQRSELFDSLFSANSLGKTNRDFTVFAFQSYVPNTWWAVAKANPQTDWFSVHEGNCVFHSTVDVEYNLAWFYLLVWPQLLEKTLQQWRSYVQTTPAGAVLSHDIGVLMGANRQQYPHQMEVEENADFILLAYALWRYSGRSVVLQDNIATIKGLAQYILDSDTTGNGVPNRGVANTVDDASPAVQFGQEQIYLGVKAQAACWATMLMLTQLNNLSDQAFATACKERADLINQTLNTAGWIDDHYAVTLDRSTAGLVNPWTQQPLPVGELQGWDAYSLYTSNGLLYLLATDPAANHLPPVDFGRLKQDLQNSLAHSLIEYGCTHSSSDLSNIWVSQNLWRDMVAGQLGIDLSQMVDRYWAFEQWENSQGRGGCFIDTYGANWLHYYPRGITAIGLWYGLSGLKVDLPAHQLSFAPVRIPLRIALPTFADWEKGLIPWVNFRMEGTTFSIEFENQQLLDSLEIISS